MHALDFFFGDDAVGHFADNKLPTANGRYRYEPYRGPGHFEMQERLRIAGQAECWYREDGERVCFSVVGCPSYGELDLAGFKRS